jgi:hypothetical protein
MELNAKPAIESHEFAVLSREQKQRMKAEAIPCDQRCGLWPFLRGQALNDAAACRGLDCVFG